MNAARYAIDDVLRAYVEAALWSSTDDAGEPLDAWADMADIAPETLAAMRADCAGFLARNADALAEYGEALRGLPWPAAELAGHDLWLTRNGHGAGFWDRGTGEAGELLTAAARALGGIDLYVGDDGRVHA